MPGRADQRADALDQAIPAAMQRASVPGAIVGIWQDGRATTSGPACRSIDRRNVCEHTVGGFPRNRQRGSGV